MSSPARTLLLLYTFACALLAAASSHASDASLWRALGEPGHVAIIRHAVAPGTGDPSGFRIGDCSTQRNLSEAGRAQSRRIGERFRSHGIAAADVFSSRWCRCLDTAKRLGLGEARSQPLLDSFFVQPDRESTQTEALRAWIAAQKTEPLLVLVTHQVNITALTGVYPAAGEIVVLKRQPDGKLQPLGRIKTD